MMQATEMDPLQQSHRWGRPSVGLILAGTWMVSAPSEIAPLSLCPSASDPQDRFREREAFIPKRNRIIKASIEQICCGTRLHPVVKTWNIIGAEEEIIVTMELVACPCGIAKNANQSVIWNVIYRDRFQVLPEAKEAARPVSLRQRFEPQHFQPMGCKSSFLSSNRDKLHVGFNPLPLLNRPLSEGEPPGVPDSKGRHDGLCPRSPLALCRANRGQQPAAVVNWIGHATSPVFNREIVCGGEGLMHGERVGCRLIQREGLRRAAVNHHMARSRAARANHQGEGACK